MRRALPGVIPVISIIGACCLVFGQPADARLKFLAADVHASPAAPVGAFAPRLRTTVYADRYELDYATIPDMIGIAWGFQTDKIVGGPNWLEMDRFDVIAKPPGGTSPDDQKRMLQTLLEERFKLIVHKDTKPVPGYALAARKPALKASSGSEKKGCTPASAPAGSVGGPGSPITYYCRNMTMDAFAQGLHGMFGTNLGPGPVLDATGLKGAWNFDLKWTLDGGLVPGNGSAARVTFLDALDKQLGLKLENRQVPASVLVVDNVNRTPTVNASDLARVMPPLSLVTRFDVASVKSSDPGSARCGDRIQPGGRLAIDCIPMRGLLYFAFGGLIEKIPTWADSDRFDIVAKAPAGTLPLDYTTLGPPLQALLRDRFKLAYHTEQRPGTAYVIEAAKPKMKKADPASRTSCRRDMAPSGSQGRLMSFTCRNITMAQFADWLSKNSIGMSGGPVSDATDLNGGWDFTLIYNPNMTQPMAPGGDMASTSGGVPSASDPTAGYSIFEAMEKQLGLKLATTKGFRPVIVIDHLEKPTAN